MLISNFQTMESNSGNQLQRLIELMKFREKEKIEDQKRKKECQKNGIVHR